MIIKTDNEKSHPFFKADGHYKTYTISLNLVASNNEDDKNKSLLISTVRCRKHDNVVDETDSDFEHKTYFNDTKRDLFLTYFSVLHFLEYDTVSSYLIPDPSPVKKKFKSDLREIKYKEYCSEVEEMFIYDEYLYNASKLIFNRRGSLNYIRKIFRDFICELNIEDDFKVAERKIATYKLFMNNVKKFRKNDCLIENDSRESDKFIWAKSLKKLLLDHKCYLPEI